MTKLVADKCRSDGRAFVVVFANTGCEHEATLRFVDECDNRWKLGVHWVETQINGAGVGPTANRVSFQTADRSGKPFEAAILKHGVFNKSYPNCTGRLKTEPMHWYIRHIIGWNDYETAVGIRADECDRIQRNHRQNRIVYPLVEAGFGKLHVNQFMSKQGFDLQLPGDHFGNCVWCWKKSLRKLYTVAVEQPGAFAFPARMEKQSRCGRVFFRENRSAEDIIREANSKSFTRYTDETQQTTFDILGSDFDVGGGCGDSCEIETSDNE